VCCGTLLLGLNFAGLAYVKVREARVQSFLSVLHVFGPETCLQCLFDVGVVWK